MSHYIPRRWHRDIPPRADRATMLSRESAQMCRSLSNCEPAIAIRSVESADGWSPLAEEWLGVRGGQTRGSGAVTFLRTRAVYQTHIQDFKKRAKATGITTFLQRNVTYPLPSP